MVRGRFTSTLKGGAPSPPCPRGRGGDAIAAYGSRVEVSPLECQWEFPGRFPLGLLILAAGVVWFITELKARNPRPQASDDVATDGRQSMVMLDPNDQA